jgi:transposase
MTARSPIKYEVIKDVPDIFEVIRVIERQGVRNYADLSEHSFTQLEKVFLCQELAKKRTDEALLMDSTDISKGHAVVTPKGVSQRYNISRNTIEWWVKKYHHGEAFTDEERKGAPEALDATSLGVVSQRIVIAEQQKRPLPFHDFLTLLGQQKAETAKRRGRLLSATEARVDEKTAYRIAEKLEIKFRKPQGLTKARVDAALDIRLTYKMAVAYKALAGYLSGYYKWNADCTTVECTSSGDDLKVCVFRGVGDHTQVASLDVSSDLSLLVKLFGLGNAGGEIGPLTAIISIKDIPEDKFFVREVNCFTCSSEIGSSGYVYLARSKGGCPGLWRHWFTNVCVPSIEKSARAHKCKVSAHGVLFLL